MFSKNKKTTNHQPTQVRMIPSIISADLKIIGDLESAGEVQIDGEVSGDIRAKVLLVGESAVIRGEVLAETVRVHGNVYGQIKAKFVNLAKTAHVVGDILHENLSIQEGAFLEGHMTHMSEQDVQAMDAVNGTVNGTADANANANANAAAKGNGSGRPGEDRVNLVVKSGQSPNAKPTATPPLNPASPAAKVS